MGFSPPLPEVLPFVSAACSRALISAKVAIVVSPIKLPMLNAYLMI
jgi:hypothetical protein